MTDKAHNAMQIQTNHWTVKNARGLRASNGSTFPAFDSFRLKQRMPGYHAWDNGPMLVRDGFIADIHGFRILIALVRPVGADFSQGERIAYFYSKDGVHYVPESLFDEHSLFVPAQLIGRCAPALSGLFVLN